VCPDKVTIRSAAGDVQVDTAVHAVELAGGGLSGNGTVESITGVGGGAGSGVVAPGVNWAPTPTGPNGILTSTGPVIWGPSTTFSVSLSSDSHPNPTVGTFYDQLVVSGGASIDIGGASLDGTVDPATVQQGDQFTIISVVGGGQRRGKFAEPFGPNVAFIGG